MGWTDDKLHQASTSTSTSTLVLVLLLLLLLLKMMNNVQSGDEPPRAKCVSARDPPWLSYH